MSLEERNKMELSLANECKTKEGATDADVTEMLARNLPTTPAAKCMQACVVETIGIMKNGKASVEGTVELAKMAFDGDEKTMKLMREIAEECVNIPDAERCEYAVKMMECGQAAFIKRGLNPKDML